MTGLRQVPEPQRGRTPCGAGLWALAIALTVLAVASPGTAASLPDFDPLSLVQWK